LPSFGGVKCDLWCVLYVFNGVYCMLSIGVVFPIYWWCKVLSMVCTVCCLCGVVFAIFWWCKVLSMVCTVCCLLVVYCFPSIGGVKCYLWCVLYVIYWWCSVCRLLVVQSVVYGVY
jgi:hypothetical protein